MSYACRKWDEGAGGGGGGGGHLNTDTNRDKSDAQENSVEGREGKG